MDIGTNIYFDLGECRAVDAVLRQVLNTTILQIKKDRDQHQVCITQWLSGNLPRSFTSLDEWRPYWSGDERIDMDLWFGEYEKRYRWLVRDASGGRMSVVSLITASTLWVPDLDVMIMDFGESVLQESIRDYILCKQLFRVLDAERCLASRFDDHCPLDDPDADQAFLFTRNGPQKLVRPLEEGRPGRFLSGVGRASEYDEDPLTGLPGWVWIVDRPFAEIWTRRS